jgi:hypothetical protein
MRSTRFALFRGLLSLAAFASVLSVCVAQDAPTTEKPPAAATAPAADAPAAPAAAPLATSQEVITQRYHRFEDTLHQLSEYLRKSDPQRAELLFRAKGKSQTDRVHDQLRAITEVLKQDQLGEAIEREEAVIAHMQAVLNLLMSEDRRDEIEKERARIKDLIKDVDRLIAKQTDARINTERGGDPTDLQKQQKNVADGTQKLVDKIDGQDAQKKTDKEKRDGTGAEPKPGDKTDPNDKKSDPKDGDSKDGDPKDGDPKNQDPKDGDDKGGKPKDPMPKDPKDPKDPKSGKPTDPKDAKPGDPKPGDPKSGDPEAGDPKSGDPKESKPSESKPGKPQKGKPKPGQPQEGQPQDQPPPDGEPQDDQNQGDDAQESDKTPGREEVEKAKQQMERAIEELKKKRNDKASDNQDQALADLQKAKEKLEEILRQLREEERAMVLAALEARLRDMLQRQEAVNNGTLGIHAVPVEKRSDRHRNRSVELARNEEEISLLAAKALTLLREEGSSVAFPEAVEQIRDDMLTVARRLERADVGEITQNIEQDIVESLQEMLEALQKELEKLKDEKEKQQQQQQQQQQQSPLVDKLGELKMLRSLQYRVNRRTKQMGRLVDGEQALDVDVVSQLRQLSDRQAKVQQATHDLATGKNE